MREPDCWFNYCDRPFLSVVMFYPVTKSGLALPPFGLGMCDYHLCEYLGLTGGCLVEPHDMELEVWPILGLDVTN